MYTVRADNNNAGNFTINSDTSTAISRWVGDQLVERRNAWR